MKNMDRTKTQFARLMELDRLIRAGNYPNCLTFSTDWEVSQKTIQRDIDYLRDQLGAPIAYDRVHKGFRYDDPTWVLPSVVLSEGELMGLLLGARMVDQYEGTPVAAELRRLFSKLTELLPNKISLRPELLFSRFTFTSPPTKPVNPDVWATVVRGLLDQRTLKIRYRRFGEETRQKKWSRINPVHIANLQGEWYVFAVHAGYDDVRQFALPRIEAAELTDCPFDMPPDFDPDALLAGTFGRYAGDGKTHRVRLLFDKEVADWITERQWHPDQKLKRRRNGDVELSFPAKGLFEVQRWVLSWGRWARVLAPRELMMAVGEELKSIHAGVARRKGGGYT